MNRSAGRGRGGHAALVWTACLWSILAAACSDRAVPESPSAATDEPAPALPTDPRAFLESFMRARMENDAAAARRHLGPRAAEQYQAGDAGLELTAAGDAAFRSWSLISFEASDANSFEARVRIELGGGFAEEILFVGPGPGLDGPIRPLVIRGAERTPAAVVAGSR